MTAASIMLVDDHPIVREGYRRLLERRSGYRVVAEAADAAEAYRLYREMSPQLVIMDLSLPGAGGLEAVRRIRAWDRDACILVFTMHQGAAFAIKAFEAGAAGYVTKSSAPEELLRAVEAVLGGDRALSADVAREIADERLSGSSAALESLSPRETEILRMIASGMPTEEVARQLVLSLKTVQNYHYQIKSKLNARTDASLVWLAIATGLLRSEMSELGRSSETSLT